MYFPTKSDALKFGNDHCPSGWSVRVWDNLGWCLSWSDGVVTVYPFKSTSGDITFHALIPDTLDDTPSGSALWSNESLDGKSVLDAVEKSYNNFIKVTNALKHQWEIMDKHVSHLLGSNCEK